MRRYIADRRNPCSFGNLRPRDSEIGSLLKPRHDANLRPGKCRSRDHIRENGYLVAGLPPQREPRLLYRGASGPGKDQREFASAATVAEAVAHIRDRAERSAHVALECLLVEGPVAAGDEVYDDSGLAYFTRGDAQPVGTGGAADRIDTPDFGPLLEQCSNAVRGRRGIRDRRARWQLDQENRTRQVIGRQESIRQRPCDHDRAQEDQRPERERDKSVAER